MTGPRRWRCAAKRRSSWSRADSQIGPLAGPGVKKPKKLPDRRKRVPPLAGTCRRRRCRMSDVLATRLSLLVRLRDARDEGAWSQFVELYAPLVFGFARKHGLQEADAADLTQDVLQAVSGGIRRLDYDPRRGSFRGWLFTVVRNKLHNFLAAQKRPGRGAGDTDAQLRLQELPAREEDQTAWWDLEYERRVFDWAAEQARDAFQ